jgi:ammonium transporter, Amt family
MTAAPAENYQLAFGLCLVFILLVPFAIAGLALINTGLGRSRSAAHAMTSVLCVISVAFFVYFVLGLSIEGGILGFFFREAQLLWNFAVLLGLMGVGLCSLIPLGACADRWRLRAACASTVILAGFTNPIFTRFASDVAALPLGKTCLPQLLDVGKCSAIQVSGGLTALSLAWLLGPRRGKYSASGMPAAIPAHNAVFVLFGCMLAWVGWLGLNSAGAILYLGSPPERSVLVVINTTFSAAAAGLAAAAVTRIRFHRPDASLIANGWMAGLVASSAGCATLKPATAILTGLIAGALVVFSVEFLEFTLKVDDPCGSISVHGVCGIWGLLAAGIFAGGAGQLMAQIVAVATLLGFVFPMSYGLNWLLNRFIPYRVSPDGERQGLDLHELGADAYPEFVVHADEFMQR